MNSTPVSMYLHKEPLACPRCGSTWRLKGELCLGCLLSQGFDTHLSAGASAQTGVDAETENMDRQQKAV